MNLILKNFISIFRRFKLAVILNVLGLSVAFAAFMVIMMQLDYDLNFDRCHPDAERIYRLEYSYSNEPFMTVINRPLVEEFLQSSPHIEGSVISKWSAVWFFSVEAQGKRDSFCEKTLMVSPGLTDVFQFDMTEGADDALKEPGNVLIPLSMAIKIFGSESAIGKQLTGKDTSYVVGGVYKDFARNTSIDNCIYYPLSTNEDLINPWDKRSQYYTTFIRLDASGDADEIIRNFKKNFDIQAMYGVPSWEKSGMDIRLTPLRELHYSTSVKYDSYPKTSREMLFVLFGIAVLIIVIAGINFTNISTALAPVRIKSINTQKILGGDNSVIRLSLIGEAIGITLIAFVIALVLVLIASDTPMSNLVDADISLKLHPLLIVVTGLIAIATGLAAGLYPAFYITSFQPAMVLKGNFGLSPKGRKLRNMLVGIQFCASFALIIGASFMYIQNRYMQQMPLGYDKDALIVTELSDGIRDSEEAFKNELLSFAGIDGVGYANFILSSSEDYGGHGRDYHGQSINFECLRTDVNFPDIIGVKINEGRDFMEEDGEKGAFIFNECARRKFDLELGELVGNLPIVGFMPDINYASLRTGIVPMAFYLEDVSEFDYTYVKVKAGANIHAAKKQVEVALKKFDSEYTFNVRFFDDVLNTTYEKELRLSAQITLAGLIAIFLSIMGVFGMVVFESEMRRKEIGIRKVFGASVKEILLLFNKTYIRILCGCFVLAAPTAWYAVDKWLENFVYKTPMYWWVYLLAFAAVMIVTVGAVTFQSWRTANQNPSESIRPE